MLLYPDKKGGCQWGCGQEVIFAWLVRVNVTDPCLVQCDLAAQAEVTLS
jgi:hypothetical protein